jgi:hypothetical protein
MIIKTSIVVLLLLTIGLASAQSIAPAPVVQTNPDFSGTWRLDMSASDFGGPKEGLVYDGLTLTIIHHDPELRITRRIFKKKRERSQEVVYFTDGRGESNPPIEGSGTIKSKTRWDLNRLASHAVMRVPGTLTIESIDRWELSSDGNTLFHFTVSSLIPASDRTIISSDDLKGGVKRVFRRVS